MVGIFQLFLDILRRAMHVLKLDWHQSWRRASYRFAWGETILSPWQSYVPWHIVMDRWGWRILMLTAIPGMSILAASIIMVQPLSELPRRDCSIQHAVFRWACEARSMVLTIMTCHVISVLLSCLMVRCVNTAWQR